MKSSITAAKEYFDARRQANTPRKIYTSLDQHSSLKQLETDLIRFKKSDPKQLAKAFSLNANHQAEMLLFKFIAENKIEAAKLLIDYGALEHLPKDARPLEALYKNAASQIWLQKTTQGSPEKREIMADIALAMMEANPGPHVFAGLDIADLVERDHPIGMAALAYEPKLATAVEPQVQGDTSQNSRRYSLDLAQFAQGFQSGKKAVPQGT